MTLLRFSLPFQCLFFVSLSITVIESKCKKGCDLALASYYAWENTNVTFISEVLHSQLVPKGVADAILDFNKQVEGEDRLKAFTRVNVPFPCDCINGEFLGHVFEYEVKSGDTYEKIASLYYSNLTTVEWLQRSNTYEADEMAENDKMNVTVNCSCGDTSVSKNYGLFITYPLLPGETLEAVLTQTNLSQDVGVLVQSYNEGVNLSGGDGLIFVPGKDASGNYRPLRSSTVGLSGMVVAGISSAVVAGFLLLATGVLYFGFYQKKKLKWAMFPSTSPKILPAQAGDAPSSKANGHKDNIIDTSVEFSHEELAQATNSFSLTHKVGEGGFGAVYYAELRGQKVAIKKMGMQASKEFLAELKVLTRVHHLNLVRLIGYCVEGSLFLVYEYIENGNLSQHLHGSGKDPLPWSTRVQIALDSARGLEYVHEHTVPVYIHRDIKSANILIDKKFHGKVADFGLAKMFPKAGRAALLPTRLVGTFGYMAPE